MNIQSINQNCQTGYINKNVNFGMKLELSKSVNEALKTSLKPHEFEQIERLRAKIEPIGKMPDGHEPMLSIISDDEAMQRRGYSPIENQFIRGSFFPYPEGTVQGVKMNGSEFLKNPIKSILKLLSGSSKNSASACAKSNKVDRNIDCELVCNQIPFENGLDIVYYTIKKLTV